MTTTKIMVAYDESAYSKRALEWALAFQRRQGATVEVVAVLSPTSTLRVDEACPFDVLNVPENNLKTMVQKKLDELGAECAARGHKVTPILLEGNVAESLLEQSIKGAADLIVAGTRGVGGFKGLLVGSVAHKLVSYAKIPVVIVK